MCVSRRGAPAGRGSDGLEAADLLAGAAVLRDIDEDTKTTVVRACRTVDWGGEGILDWWCTEHPEAFSADQPLYVTMEAELRRVCGDAVYEELAAYCEARLNGEARRLTLLPMIP